MSYIINNQGKYTLWNGKYGIPAVSTSTSSLLSGLVSYYKLDESSGNATDTVSGYTGANTSITYSTTGKINTCYSYNGSSSKTVVTDTDALDLTTAGGFSCWIYPLSRSYNYIISKMNDSSNTNGYYLGLFSGYAQLLLATGSNSSYLNSTSLVTLSAWHHVVATWNSTTAYIYLNGSGNSGSITYTPISSTYNLQIGSPVTDTGGYFSGYIDEVGIWNRLITSDEAATLYNSGSGKAYPFS